MAFNFKLLFRQTGKLIILYRMELRGFYWNLPWNKSGIFSIKIFPGYQFKFLKRGDIAEVLYKNQILIRYKKSFEYETLNLITSILKPTDTVLDIGANSGLYSIFFSKLVGEEGKVLSFEPEPETFSLMQENIRMNDCANVRTYNLALSNKNTSVKMVSYSPDHGSEGDSFKYMEEVNQSEMGSANKVNEINAVRLDSMKDIWDLKRIDFLKIDVEGAELLVLEGAKEVIMKFKPVIVFELYREWTKRFEYKPIDLLLFLHGIGYNVEEYDTYQWIATPS